MLYFNCAHWIKCYFEKSATKDKKSKSLFLSLYRNPKSSKDSILEHEPTLFNNVWNSFYAEQVRPILVVAV